MAPTSAAAVPALDGVASRIDELLLGFLEERRAEAAAIEPRSTEPIEEIERLVRAGGKRIRPAFCVWGYRAAGGLDVPAIWNAAAALELLHTMALIHDDVMDDDEERRGEPTVHARQTAAATRRGQTRPQLVGTGIAILAGDLAAAFADQLLARAGFPPERQAAGAARFQTIRLELALGAYLDLSAAEVAADTVAYLKGGAYTVEGPLLVGAALAGGSPLVDEALRRYARPLGAAFQLLDDLADGDAPAGATCEDAAALVARARATLGEPLASEAVVALDQLAELVGSL
jgi:geranylgeranyl diphosphate synthase type I